MVDQNKISPEIREAIELLYFGYREFTRGPDRILAKRGLGRAHHRVLYFVARSPGISVSELLEHLDISKQALNLPLRQLVAMELIRSRKDSGDKRRKQLELTASGKRLEHRLTDTQSELLTAVFDGAGPKAEDAWREVMRALGDARRQ